MAEAGSGDPFSGKTDAFLRSARSSKTSRGVIDSIMADHGRSGTSFWGSIGSFFSSEVLPRVGGVAQAGWGLLQMNLGFGLIVGSGFAEGLSGGTLTPLAIVGAVGGGMLAFHGSGDLWAGMQTAWDGKPHEKHGEHVGPRRCEIARRQRPGLVGQLVRRRFGRAGMGRARRAAEAGVPEALP